MAEARTLYLDLCHQPLAIVLFKAQPYVPYSDLAINIFANR